MTDLDSVVSGFMRRQQMMRRPIEENVVQPSRTERGVSFEAKLRPVPVMDDPQQYQYCVPYILYKFETTLPPEEVCCEMQTYPPTPGVTGLSSFFDTAGVAIIPVPLLGTIWWRVQAEASAYYAYGRVLSDGTLSTSGPDFHTIYDPAGVSGLDPSDKAFKTFYCYTEEVNIEIGCGGETAFDATWPAFDDSIDDNNSHDCLE